MNKDVIYPSMVIRAQEETINKLEEEINKQAKAIQIYEKELQRKDNIINELQKELNEYKEREEMQYLIKDEERFNYSMDDQVDY